MDCRRLSLEPPTPTAHISSRATGPEKPQRWLLGHSARALEDKGPTFNRVHQDIPALEERVVAPATDKIKRPPVGQSVILRVDVKEANLLNPCTSRVSRQACDIEEAQPRTVMALICDAINHKLVVVNTVAWTLEETSLLGVLEGADVPEVGDGVSAGGWPSSVDLVELIVEDKKLLPLRVCDPGLMRVWVLGRE